MSDLLVRGGRDAAGRRCDVAIRDGLVTAVADDPVAAQDTLSPDGTVLNATGTTVLPGLIDLQVNGACGADLTAEPDRLWEVATALTAYGVTAFAPTVITSDPRTRAAALAVLRAGPPDRWRGAVPLGWHFEGPMIAGSRRGAHPERWVAAPAAATIADWSRAAGVLMATLAPELPGALDVIAQLTARGIVVAVGHTAATGDQTRAAVAAGATALTHLGNAMPPMTSREPGPVGVALGDDTVIAGVIVDGHHHDPSVLRTFWKALGPDRFLAVSDATAALGQPPGETRLGDQVVVIADGAVRLPDGTLAGSAASLVDCLRILMTTTGCSLADAVATATTTPARLIGDASRGRLRPGARGDLLVVDDDLRVIATVVAGRVVHGRGSDR